MGKWVKDTSSWDAEEETVQASHHTRGCSPSWETREQQNPWRAWPEQLPGACRGAEGGGMSHRGYTHPPGQAVIRDHAFGGPPWGTPEPSPQDRCNNKCQQQWRIHVSSQEGNGHIFCDSWTQWNKCLKRPGVRGYIQTLQDTTCLPCA